MGIRKVRVIFLLKVIVFSVLFLICCPQQTQCQKKFKADSAKMAAHSPRKAALYSAVFPGLGQIYNHQYYKAPIVYIGLGIAAGFIIYNNQKYIDYKLGYRDLYLDDGDSYKSLPAYYEQYDRSINLTSLENNRDMFRRWLEMSYIAFGALYILNIAEANVSAHFMKFDIDEDLTLRVTPSLQPSFGNNYLAKGLTLSFSF